MNEQTWRRIRDKLGNSRFRSSFKLGPKEKAYLEKYGRETIRAHAEQFIIQRLAPAFPKNDGRQTPFKGHPVFIAQHATGTCCRACLKRWHAINPGKPLNAEEVNYIADIILYWLYAKVLSGNTNKK